jgi:hypothetical protein
MKSITVKKYILVFLICLLILSFYYNNTVVDNMDTNIVNKSCQLVISHYNEDLSYLNDVPFVDNTQIIYTKGIISPECLQCDNIIKLDNVGVCVHTYLHHIIENYDNLADVTVFLPGSCMDDHKKMITLDTINNAVKTNNSVFYVTNYGDNILNIPDIYNFTIENYLSTNQKNKDLNADNELSKSDVRPFGKWYETVFPETDITSVNYMGIFAVSKSHIQNRSKESYEELIKYVNRHKNEESAHYFERSFLAVFNPIPDDCQY